MRFASHVRAICFGISVFSGVPAIAVTLNVTGLDYEVGFHESFYGKSEVYTYDAGDYQIIAFGDAPYYPPFSNKVYTRLSDGYTGYEDNNAEKIRLARKDSGKFALSSLAIDGLYTGYWAWFENDLESEFFPVPVTRLLLRYQRAGIVSERSLSPWVTSKPDSSGYSSGSVLETRLFGVDWVELSIGPADINLCRKSIRDSIKSTSLAADVRAYCSGAVNEVSTFLDWAGPRNDTAVISIRSFEVQAVPLPASVLLLGSAFAAAFGGLRAARRSRSRKSGAPLGGDLRAA